MIAKICEIIVFAGVISIDLSPLASSVSSVCFLNQSLLIITSFSQYPLSTYIRIVLCKGQLISKCPLGVIHRLDRNTNEKI